MALSGFISPEQGARPHGANGLGASKERNSIRI